MTHWTKLSKSQPTDEDYKAGVVFGAFSHTGQWIQTRANFAAIDISGYTHWQRVSLPEQPRLRRWWANSYPGQDIFGYATKEEADIAASKDRIECIQVIEWPYKDDPVRGESK